MYIAAVNTGIQLSNIEKKLMQLNIEKDKLRDKLAKICEYAKNGALIRRRETWNKKRVF